MHPFIHLSIYREAGALSFVSGWVGFRFGMATGWVLLGNGCATYIPYPPAVRENIHTHLGSIYHCW